MIIQAAIQVENNDAINQATSITTKELFDAIRGYHQAPRNMAKLKRYHQEFQDAVVQAPNNARKTLKQQYLATAQQVLLMAIETNKDDIVFFAMRCFNYEASLIIITKEALTLAAKRGHADIIDQLLTPYQDDLSSLAKNLEMCTLALLVNHCSEGQRTRLGESTVNWIHTEAAKACETAVTESAQAFFHTPNKTKEIFANHFNDGDSPPI